MKKLLRSAITFWGITAMFPLCYIIYNFFTIGEGSYWIFGAQDGYASATTWVDVNANGIQDAGEKPLANVCIWSGYSPKSGVRETLDPCESDYLETTDEQGKWYRFLSNGSCKEYFVFTRAPDGYQATTDLASNGCDAKFGFALSTMEVNHRILGIEQFIRQQTTIL